MYAIRSYYERSVDDLQVARKHDQRVVPREERVVVRKNQRALRDRVRVGVRGQRVAADALVAERSAVRGRFAGRRAVDVLVRQRRAVVGLAGGVRVRITSYNVCYTKLLRLFVSASVPCVIASV